MSSRPIKITLRVYDSMSNLKREQNFTQPSKAAAEWMLLVAQGKTANLVTEYDTKKRVPSDDEGFDGMDQD